MDPATFKAWIGRTETTIDVATTAPVMGLAALLDYPASPWGDEIPPLGHWFYFLPQGRQSELDYDGHSKRGGFLPPIELPRRMWAGSRLAVHGPIRIGDPIERQSRILDVVPKTGASGPLVFLKVRHEIFAHGTLAVSEEHDIVYREAPKPGAPSTAGAPGAPRAAQFKRTISPNSVMLFRYSALTFNGHRIHYDREFAKEEGYPGLVVHGPLIATLLADHFFRHKPGAFITKFDLRLQAPLFDTEPFDVCLNETKGGAELWSARGDGQVSSVANLEYTVR